MTLGAAEQGRGQGLGRTAKAPQSRPAQRGEAERSGKLAQRAQAERAASEASGDKAGERSRQGLGRIAKAPRPRPAQRGAAERSSSRAFTLIELLAVLLIMALVAGLTLPNLSLGAERAVLGEAEDLASIFAFTRQRAVATGSPHRVVIDLDEIAYWIEAEPEDLEAFASPPLAAPAPGGRRAVQLAAPATGATGFLPLVGPFGRPHLLADPVFFDSIETLAAGAVRSGQIEIRFDPDGTADPALLVLANPDGDTYVLRLSRLADEVRIARE